MFKAVVLLYDVFVIGYAADGPRYDVVRAEGTWMCRSPKEAVNHALDQALSRFVLPEVWYNRVDNDPFIKLYKGTELIFEQEGW